MRDEIRAGGSISFARFMDVALHDPAHGYYARGPARLGRGGDFFTASDVGPAWGRALARALVEMDAAAGRPRPFRYVEHGAGRGLLARDLIDALAALDADLHARLEAELIDSSAAMREAAGRLVPEAHAVAPAGARVGGAGCAVAFELLDALPVHRVRRRGAGLLEVRVALEGERLVEAEAPPEPAVSAAAESWGAAPEDGDEAEVCLALPAAVAALAASIDRGFVVVVDYGHEAERLAARAHRRGTLLAYSGHEVNEDYLLRVGEQDLTAHVNLTVLRREAERIGLAMLAVTTQDRFLVAGGILEGMDDGDRSLDALKRRLQAKQLIHPAGMGTTFKVAVFSKGIVPPPELRSLRDPFG
jgi:SAM-dependent MidA family methyltransferase